ncbi:MAG: YihY/virulence factor BrkB family protein [Planctomycetes bacterium]|nr:YihY/virulence factor BrkB family protein [Planctomycetota bacterium]
MSMRHREPEEGPEHLHRADQFDRAIRVVERLAKSKYAPRQVFEVLRLAARGAATTQLDRTAAALTYRTLFSLIPMLVIGLAVIGAFATPDQISETVSRFLRFAGVSNIVVGETSPTGKDLPEGLIFGKVEAPVSVNPFETVGDITVVKEQQEAPKPPPGLEQWITDLVSRVRGLPFRTIGLVGLGVLIYGAISMLVEIERAFNGIYHAPTGRHWLKRITLYWTLITLGTIGLVATFYVQESLTSWVDQLLQQDLLSGIRGPALRVVAYAITVLISTALLLIVYTTVPNTRVSFGPALAGALCAAIVFEASKWGFTQYLKYSAGYSRFYGSLALLPLFMLWVYLTWLIVLVGLQLAYSMQSFGQAVQIARQGGVRGLRTAAALLGLAPEARRDPGFVDPASVLAIMCIVGEKYAKGSPADAAEIARQTGISEAVMEELLRRLLRERLLLKVEDGERDAFAPGRPLEVLTAAEVLRAGESLCGDLAQSGDRRVMEMLSLARAKAVEGRTVADMIRESGRVLPAASMESTPTLPHIT